MNKHSLFPKLRALGQTALMAAAFSLAATSGLQAEDSFEGTREFKEGKELDGEGTLWIGSDAVLKFTGENTTVERTIDIKPRGRRNHGYGIIEVVGPKAELTVKVLLGNNEPGVFRRTEKRGPGTLVLSGDEDNMGAKLVVKEGTVVFAKTSDSATHAHGGGGWLEIYSDAAKGTVGTVRLGGTGNDQISDEGNILMNGGVLDLNTRFETVSTLGVENATFRFAFGGAAGKTGTLTVDGMESAFRATGKNTIAIDNADAWLPGQYNLFFVTEGIAEEAFKTFSLTGIPNGKLTLSESKKAIVLVVENKGKKD